MSVLNHFWIPTLPDSTDHGNIVSHPELLCCSLDPKVTYQSKLTKAELQFDEHVYNLPVLLAIVEPSADFDGVVPFDWKQIVLT